jgi:hypothetical protein
LLVITLGEFLREHFIAEVCSDSRTEALIGPGSNNLVQPKAACNTGQSYLDEFVFRFNRRRTRHAAFRSLLGIAVGHPPLSYNMLISPEAKS